MKLEVEELQKDMTKGGDELKAIEDTIKGFEEQISQLQEAVQDSKVSTHTYDYNFKKLVTDHFM